MSAGVRRAVELMCVIRGLVQSGKGAGEEGAIQGFFGVFFGLSPRQQRQVLAAFKDRTGA